MTEGLVNFFLYYDGCEATEENNKIFDVWKVNFLMLLVMVMLVRNNKSIKTVPGSRGGSDSNVSIQYMPAR